MLSIFMGFTSMTRQMLYRTCGCPNIRSPIPQAQFDTDPVRNCGPASLAECGGILFELDRVILWLGKLQDIE
jgi:hypothetical protein